jgi:CheY-like chemotaxis protein
MLVVDDNPGDVDLLREALREKAARVELRVVRDGEEAIAFLRREGTWSHAPRPDLIVLDLNLPRVDGREVLARIKQDPELRRIPIVVMTSSGADQDVLRSYELGANCYVTKPIDLDEFFRVVRSMQEFWLSVARRPPR